MKSQLNFISNQVAASNTFTDEKPESYFGCDKRVQSCLLHTIIKSVIILT